MRCGKYGEDVAVLAAQAKDDQHFDISLPIPKIGSLIDQITANLKKLPVVDRILPLGMLPMETSICSSGSTKIILT